MVMFRLTGDNSYIGVHSGESSAAGGLTKSMRAHTMRLPIPGGTMSTFPEAQLAHVGYYVRDLEMMVAFYKRVFGLVVTDTGVSTRPGSPTMAFLSRNPDEHHQIALATGRGENAPTTINQISFRVADLEDVRTWHRRLVELGIANIDARNHGNAWSLYFFDPEGNRLEVYTPTEWYVGQPFGQTFDPTKSAETLRAETAAMVASDPTHCPMREWSARVAAAIV
jgi:catechol 2,3-dioxygenase